MTIDIVCKMRGVKMTVVALIIVIALLMVDITLGLSWRSKSVASADLQTENARLQGLVDKLSLEVEQNKRTYGIELESDSATIAANDIVIKTLRSELARFTKESQVYQSEMDNLNNYSREMSPEELLEIRAEVMKKDSGLHDFTGIYVLENKTVDKFYVGQSISLFKRCGAHFTGDGNKDIYEDYSNGEIWSVRLIALADSGFKSINALEKHFIEYYHSTYNGYNKTIGNAN